MRSSGILLHISSLPSPYGIGTLGKAAYDFIDFLEQAGQHNWQILPLNPTDYGDSPYQSSSVFAGNPYFIDLDLLCEEQILFPEECSCICWGTSPEKVDYAALKQHRLPLLRVAFRRFRQKYGKGTSQRHQFFSFYRQNSWWLEDYALYMALKEHFQQAPWNSWPLPIRLHRPDAVAHYRRLLAKEIGFYAFLQFLFYRQWAQLRQYAETHNVQLIGDLPIYVAPDSADIWANRSLFQCDSQGQQLASAGVPPDAFSQTGQMWGNPLYRWDKMKKDGYQWWLRRLAFGRSLFHMIRIDHFRGLESYFAIPAGSATAQSGHWEKGPGFSLFRAMRRQLGPMRLIAEDLGLLTPQVHQLRQKAGLPGMKILQFAFSTTEESTYLPHNCEPDCVVYTGTHDNNTLLGWFDNLSESDRLFACQYLNLPVQNPRSAVSWTMVRTAWATPAHLAMAQMQDLLELGEEARMNTPATVGCNWQWRMLPLAATPQIARRLYLLTKIYARLPQKQPTANASKKHTNTKE